MDIVVLRDLIKDDRGNYYVAVQINGNEMTLVNAFVEVSFQTILLFNDNFKGKYESYEHQFIGKIPMDELRHKYVDVIKPGAGNMYTLDEAAEAFQLIFIDTIEFYRNPKHFCDEGIDILIHAKNIHRSRKGGYDLPKEKVAAERDQDASSKFEDTTPHERVGIRANDAKPLSRNENQDAQVT